MNKIIQKNEGFEDVRNCKKTAQQRKRQLKGAGEREERRDGRESANVRREREEGD